MRALHWVMTVVFVFAVVVQFNDPDSLVWILMYVAASAVAATAAVRGAVPRAVAGGMGLLALVWGLALALRVPGLDVYGYMFDAWEMKSEPIEVAREASGLFITAAWMAVLALRGSPARAAPARSGADDVAR